MQWQGWEERTAYFFQSQYNQAGGGTFCDKSSPQFLRK
jgi:hypothetical protein